MNPLSIILKKKKSYLIFTPGQPIPSLPGDQKEDKGEEEKEEEEEEEEDEEEEAEEEEEEKE